MKNKLKGIVMAILTFASLACTSKIEKPEQIPATNVTATLKAVPDTYATKHFYTSPDHNTPKVTFIGTTSAQLNNFITAKSMSGGAIITIPQGTYAWNNIQLKSNIHLEIEAGTVIKPENNSTRRIFSLGGTSANGGRIKNVSIIGSGGKFNIDISDPGFSNKKIVAVVIGRVSNFKLYNFAINDRRSAVASITLAYIGGTSERAPWANTGVVANITQTGAHTGYGLVQAYASNKVLFKNLNCEGGVTLRFETDDRVMRDEVKNGEKVGGIRNIFAYNIKGTYGIAPLMISPNFATNGKLTIEKVTAIGCAFAVRVEHGFIELFDIENKFSTSDKTNGQKFKNYIESQFDLPSSIKATSGNAYKRNNGTMWAIGLSEAGINAPRNTYVRDQIGDLKLGTFASSSVTNITAIYKNNGAKIKQAYLKYIPCSEWSKIKNPGTSLGMTNGFEYHGPSVSLSYNNTNGTRINGNYIIKMENQFYKNFPSGHTQNIKYNTAAKCNNNPNTIESYTATY